jgi:hypothetical protein
VGILNNIVDEGTIYINITDFLFFQINSSSMSLNKNGADHSIASTAVDNLPADKSGRVVLGKYVPTKEEIFHHEQVLFRLLVLLKRKNVLFPWCGEIL